MIIHSRGEGGQCKDRRRGGGRGPRGRVAVGVEGCNVEESTTFTVYRQQSARERDSRAFRSEQG